MKALYFDQHASIIDKPKPVPAPGEALVKVSLAGVCKTDVEIVKGYMGFKGVLGHEFVGVVETAPDKELIGARVVGEINAGCGECDFCKASMERHCFSRTVLGIVGRDGALAEYLVLPVANLVRVPDSVSDEKAVFVEPLAAALEILEQTQIRPVDRALIIGDGKLGQLICMVLRLTGCDLTVLGKHPEKLELFSRLGGKTRVLDPASPVVPEYDVVVEASGNQSGWDLAVKSVKPRGKIVLKSTYQGALDFNPAPLVINEITVVGSRCGKFEPALRLMETGLVDPTVLISEIIPFAEILKAFDASRYRGALKILAKMD